MQVPSTWNSSLNAASILSVDSKTDCCNVCVLYLAVFSSNTALSLFHKLVERPVEYYTRKNFLENVASNCKVIPSFLLPSYLPSFIPSFLFCLPSILPSFHPSTHPFFLASIHSYSSFRLPSVPSFHSSILPFFVPPFPSSIYPSCLSFFPSFITTLYPSLMSFTGISFLPSIHPSIHPTLLPLIPFHPS